MCDGKRYYGRVVLATGAWSASLLPDLTGLIEARGQAVVQFALTPSQVPKLSPQCVWAADISKTGFYGFPANANGLMKIANHGEGYTRMYATGKGEVSVPRTALSHAGGNAIPVDALERFRVFFAEHFPALNELDIANTRMCWYCDSFDGHFIISQVPSNGNVIVATGGSGHAFKFAPIIGRIVVDAMNGVENFRTSKFRWRVPAAVRSTDAIRSTMHTVKDLSAVQLATRAHLLARSFVNGRVVSTAKL
jgi:sarcosine oxidase/L-pipecolate oxidase